ncbi:MAG TPA: sugar ABC transporter permease, partial [Lachnospiraceae bacterium]|nr:sugar ABC transporter permease [Lachnospiraceae bacterium]
MGDIKDLEYVEDEKTNGVAVRTRRIIAYVVLILITIMCLFWFYVLFINATRSNSALKKGFTMLPGGYLGKNLYSLFHNSNLPIIRGLINSLIVAICTAFLSTYFSTMTAFAIHAYDFKLKKFMFTFILAIMMIPTQVTALGFINLLRKIKLMDSFIPLIVPAIAAPAVFFYMKQYMEANIPLDLMESARIDGAGEFLIYNRIAFPLMKPAIAVQAIFSFVTSWNNYFTPALVLKSDNKKTLPILIALLRSADFLKFDMG